MPEMNPHIFPAATITMLPFRVALKLPRNLRISYFQWLGRKVYDKQHI